MDPHNTVYRDALYLLAPFWTCTWWHGGTTVRSSRTQELHLELLMESYAVVCDIPAVISNMSLLIYSANDCPLLQNWTQQSVDGRDAVDCILAAAMQLLDFTELAF
jgi:hypothetical protein